MPSLSSAEAKLTSKNCPIFHFMKTILLALFLSLNSAWAGPILNLDNLGQKLGGWTAKGKRAADYERSGSKYRTWKPEVTQTHDGGLFISVRIDHLRGLLASDDHASLQITLDHEGQIISAQSSMAFQGKKITSDAIRLGASAGTSVLGVEQAAKIGTDLLADLSSKVLRENVAEPGRVTFPAVIHHNYNLVCLATGMLEEETSDDPAPAPTIELDSEPTAKPDPEPTPKTTKTPSLELKKDKNTLRQIGKPVPLPASS